jgi:hypothetical protein
MHKTAFLFFLLSYTICDGQTIAMDTFRAKKAMARIDSLEHVTAALGDIIVRKYLHNETTVNHEFLLDTLSQQIYRCVYIRLTEDLNDTVMERSSFYVDGNNFIAVMIQLYRNGKEIFSAVNYLSMQNGEIKNISPNPTSKIYTSEDIKYQAKDLWPGIESLKEWFRRKNGG